MVSIGSKALTSGRHTINSVSEGVSMNGEDDWHEKNGKKRSMNRKATKKHPGFSGKHDDSMNARKFSKHKDEFVPQTPSVRKQIDPETVKYFSEIANVIEGTEVELEERSVICGNALEETRGKEVEIANDYIVSHTLQTLLEGCSLDHLCNFLQSCGKDFPCIAMDRSGSHVAESALKSLAIHLQDNGTESLIEETLTMICQAILINPVDVMCNCYGSHVLRSLLCLCKGVPLDSSEFHTTKSSTVLAARLNFNAPSNEIDSHSTLRGFPNLLKYFVSEMLKCSRNDIGTLQVNQYSSYVLQTALKLLLGYDEDLLSMIAILLGCKKENAGEGNLIENKAVRSLLNLMKESAYSHLMEVILEVAPETVYNELITRVFRNSMFELSSHHCGNFVIQALVSHARCENHMELIWEELGSKFADLLGMGRSGVVANLIAVSQRLHSHENKCCQALATAFCSADEPPTFIVPRILFLESYYYCEDPSKWTCPRGVKMHVMGSLILQSVFKFPSEFIQPYITSLTSMEADHILEASKDSGGARVIEAFLSSNVSGKQKRKVVMMLQGHFGELAMNPSGSYAVEKCFNISKVSMKEAIVSELVAVQTELSKTRQGPLLLRKLDVDGFARRPDQWKSRQSSKQSAYKEYFAAFGSEGAKPNKTDSFGSEGVKSFKIDGFLSEAHGSLQPKNMKEMRKDIDARLASAAAPPGSGANDILATKSSMSGHKRHRGRVEQHDEKLTEHAMENKSNKHKKKKSKGGG